MLKTHQEELDKLAEMGFATNPFNQTANTLPEIWAIKEKLEQEKDNLNYPIDGLVVKLNDNQLTEKLGVVGKTNRGWCAIKFEAQEITTKILSVSWQVGRTGKITPVADLEAVELQGTTVKRATLHNYKEFLEKNLHSEDTLIIRKAGDIIPEVVAVLDGLRLPEQKKFDAPTLCPSCQSPLQTSNTEVDLICANTQNCPDQVLGRLIYFCQRNIASITGLSEKQIEKFIELYEIKDIPDLYKLPYQKILELEGFGEKSVENLKEAVEKARNIPDYKFLAGLSIEGVGPEIAKLICENLVDLNPV